jgi:REP element-mobilizing transposase RayT
MSEGPSPLRLRREKLPRYRASVVTYYERNLPRWHPPGVSIFLTWRLYGSLPKPITPGGAESTANETFSQRFRKMDAVLDCGADGPVWLKDKIAAECVTSLIERGARELRHYRLHAFVVMPNHIHLLIAPLRPVGRLTNSLKGTSARKCNRILGRTGIHFWRDESFDRWVRTTNEFERIRAYIEQNPVTAGLVEKPENWPWSSASRRSAVT